jgi:dolichyl-phosphate-mannose-protein mannosyltransferase
VPRTSDDDDATNPVTAPAVDGADSPPGSAPEVQHALVDTDGSVAPSDAPVDEPVVPTETRLLRRLLGEGTLTLDATPRARLMGWIWPLVVTVFAAVIRLWNLGRPHVLVFDETYYVKDAYSLLVHGYEAAWGDNPNPRFEAGDVSMLGTAAEYVVHPPVGKWMIALGMQLGGGVTSSFAWRLGPAIAGILAVLMVARIARRMFASTALSTTAGLLMAIDGEAIVHSRIGLLDGFVMFFALAAFGALVLDREQARRRLAHRTAAILDSGGDLGWGPRLGWRWWRLAAGVLLGLCIGTKWSGLYFLAMFGLLSVIWDATARRAVGVRPWHVSALVRDAIPAGAAMVSLAFVTYLGSWWGWFRSTDGYMRQWAVQNPGQGVSWLPPALRSLWKYHTDMWYFHTHLVTPHPYAASPLGWIVQWRPTSYFYPADVSSLSGAAAQRACGSSACSQAITSLGNPLLWWSAAAMVVVVLVWLVQRRDWRAGAVLSGIAAGWLPWFMYMHRTIFTFYSIAFTPWVVLTLTFALGLVVGPRGDDPERRRKAVIGVTAYVVLLVVISAFFYPIWTAWVVPYWFWHAHMWLPSWI